MKHEQIRCETSDQVMTITLSRPDRMNAFTRQMMHELIDAFDKADADDGVRAVIVTGEGRAFCAGADLGEGAKTFDYRARGQEPVAGERRDGGGMLALRIFEMKKPVIAAINGPAVGVGITMTLPMDIRLASDTAKMGFVFTRRGIVPEACSTWMLPKIVGISQALEWIYSGRVFSAQDALAGRLVSRVVPGSVLLDTAREIAREIAENTSAVSVALCRQMFWRMLGADHPMQAHKVESLGIFAMGASADAKEGVMSFLEKRPAKFAMSPSKDMPAFFPWWKERPFSEEVE